MEDQFDANKMFEETFRNGVAQAKAEVTLTNHEGEDIIVGSNYFIFVSVDNHECSIVATCDGEDMMQAARKIQEVALEKMLKEAQQAAQEATNVRDKQQIGKVCKELESILSDMRASHQQAQAKKEIMRIMLNSIANQLGGKYGKDN